MATALNKELKREVIVDGLPYTIALNVDCLRLTGKGKRKPEVELRWRDLLNGDAAMAVALNASLGPAARTPTARVPTSQSKPVRKKLRADNRRKDAK